MIFLFFKVVYSYVSTGENLPKKNGKGDLYDETLLCASL